MCGSCAQQVMTPVMSHHADDSPGLSGRAMRRITSCGPTKLRKRKCGRLSRNASAASAQARTSAYSCRIDLGASGAAQSWVERKAFQRSCACAEAPAAAQGRPAHLRSKLTLQSTVAICCQALLVCRMRQLPAKGAPLSSQPRAARVITIEQRGYLPSWAALPGACGEAEERGRLVLQLAAACWPVPACARHVPSHLHGAQSHACGCHALASLAESGMQRTSPVAGRRALECHARLLLSVLLHHRAFAKRMRLT